MPESSPESPVTERMRADWNERARQDAHYYVAFGGREQDEAAFDATAAEVLPSIEIELKRFPKDANRRAWRALEIGCGPGRLVKPLSRVFGEIHGVDVSDEMIRLARERLAHIPHAHFHATNGASLAQFADDSFDFVYSYAVFQHIPSRDVVLEYMREIRRVLKSGGIFRGQFNGRPHTQETNTWSGAVFSAAEICAFTRENGLQLLGLEGDNTQYMWTTWRKGLPAPPLPTDPAPAIRRITHAYSWEPAIPNRGRHAVMSLLMDHLPPACDVNSLQIEIDSIPTAASYIAPRGSDGLQQINVWLPAGLRTGLLPVEVRWHGKRICDAAIVRVIPAGPMVPRIVSVTDGIHLVQQNRSTSGLVKVQMEEIGSPESISASIGGQPLAALDILETDPRAPRYELNLKLPEDTPPGPHLLEIYVPPHRLLKANILVNS